MRSMTYIDLANRSRSTIHIQYIRLEVGNIHEIFQDPRFIITRDIKHSVTLGQRPIGTLKIGQSQPYTYRHFAFF
jgi:hypothetical protein